MSEEAKQEMKVISVIVGAAKECPEKEMETIRKGIVQQSKKHQQQINAALQDGYHIAFVTPATCGDYVLIAYTLLRGDVSGDN